VGGKCVNILDIEVCVEDEVADVGTSRLGGISALPTALVMR